MWGMREEKFIAKGTGLHLCLKYLYLCEKTVFTM